MTENEVKVIKHINDLSGDYKCYDEKLTHEEALLLDKLLSEIQAYQAIGTIEEFKALKEKAEGKKPISIDGWGEYWKCPTCGKYVVDNLGCKYKYCRECGTKFDWS